MKTSAATQSAACRSRFSAQAQRVPVFAAALLLLLFLDADRNVCQGGQPDIFRVAFSSNIFTDLKPNDAKAALKFWAQSVAKEHNMDVQVEATVFTDFAEMEEALRARRMDAVGMTIVEYARLRKEIQFWKIFVAQVNGSPLEQLLLLSHRDNPASSLEQLKGGRLLLHENTRACLSGQWLGNLLARKGLKPADQFFGSCMNARKPSQVVLPVFFKKSEACIIPRSVYLTMQELNPQIDKSLKVVERSGEFVPALFALFSWTNPVFAAKLADSLGSIHKTPSGQQVLNIFYSDKLEEKPESYLLDTLGMIEKHSGASVAGAYSRRTYP